MLLLAESTDFDSFPVSFDVEDSSETETVLEDGTTFGGELVRDEVFSFEDPTSLEEVVEEIELI